MSWENINERLLEAFKVKVSFPTGTVLLPDTHLNISQWLTAIAETDQELKELNIPRLRFLQNRWPIEKLIELEWDDPGDSKSAIWSMTVGRRAFILFSNRGEFQLIAAVEPAGNQSLYRAVIGKLLQNPEFVPKLPSRIHNLRSDLIPDVFETIAQRGDIPWARAAISGSNVPETRDSHPRNSYLSNLLIGWVGAWIDLPVLGFWHEDLPDSITTSKKGKYTMKYKQTYSDKQREAQKNQKEKEDQAHHKSEDNVGKVGSVESPLDRKSPTTDQEKDKGKNAA